MKGICVLGTVILGGLAVVVFLAWAVERARQHIDSIKYDTEHL